MSRRRKKKILPGVIGGMFKLTRLLIDVSVLISFSPFRILRRFFVAKPLWRIIGKGLRFR